MTGLPVWAEELGVVTGSSVNVRTGPGTANAVVTQVSKGDSLKVLAKSADWVKISLNNGKEGWIKSSYLNVKTSSSDSGSTTDKYVQITGKIVNVRKGPGTGYGIVTKIGLNEKHKLLGEQKGWYKIQAGSKQGWISATLAKKVTVAAPAPSTPAPTPTPSPGLPVPVPTPLPSQTTLTVTGNIVNIRSAGNLEAQVLDKVSLGTRLPVLAKAGDWYQVQLTGGTSGWIAGWLAELGNSSTPSRSSSTEVLAAPLGEGRVFRILDVAGRPTLVLEGWQQEQYEVNVHKQTKTMTLELQGSTGINYQGSLAKLGIQSLTITPQGQKALISITFAYIPAESITFDGVKATSYLNIAAETSQGLGGKVIVVDPGHSGMQNGGWLDPGAIGPVTKLQEREITLSVATKLKALLERAGASVIMTHTNSTSLSLAERAAVANNSGAAIYVSIHANSSVNKSLSGHTTYFYAPLGDELLGAQRYDRQKLANLVQREMVKAAGRKDMGVQEENFAVLRETRVPSILVETAFLSDRQEEYLLGQETFRQQLAEGIFRGIEAYFE